ncbi:MULTISPECIES: hybrid sensor histidine kinase/response regulator [unclassified Achromobacter]|uniref:hybrid sensor histidine kinase/response regulator n=1 Tax=unclassified Achromobacter TaxID=2626865 RepID=UPI00130365C9|nr:MULTISPECIES: hybrid sensor histidine kinase/response regulator [unclassified Achromobacter]
MNARILVVGNDSVELAKIQDELRRARPQFDVRYATGEDVFERMLRLGEIDAIVADFDMLDFGNAAVIDMVKDISPDIPLIFLSQGSGEELAIAALKQGATDYVLKHLRLRLPSSIDRALTVADTARKRRDAETSLRALNSMLEDRVRARTQERDLVWRITRDLMVICDADGEVLSCNPAWTTLLGWEQSVLIGRHFQSLLAPPSKEIAVQACAQLSRYHYIPDVDLELMRADLATGREFNWNFTKIEDGRVFAVGRDLTQRKAIEAQLVQSQRMESLGQLTGEAAHDFANVLMIIQGNLQTLKSFHGAAYTERQSRFLENGLKGITRGAYLTKALLAYARKGAHSPQETNVGEVVKRTANLLAPALGAEISLELDIVDGVWPVFVDGNELEVALVNLSNNARDSLSEARRGRLLISVKNCTIKDEFSGGGRLPAGDYVELTMTDNGMGMLPEVQAKAFDPFFSTKRGGHSNGIGLSQVYGFAKQCGGNAVILTTPNVGTSVRLLFPRLAKSASESSREPAV